MLGESRNCTLFILYFSDCFLIFHSYSTSAPVQELQEEVDQLLNKTRVEMHATVQPGGRSPKPMNGSMST